MPRKKMVGFTEPIKKKIDSKKDRMKMKKGYAK